MKHVTKHAALWSFTAVFAVFVLLMALFKIGPQVEAEILPLFVEVKGAYIESDKAHVDLIVTGIKNRNCLLTAVYATVLVDGNWVTGQAILLNRDGSRLSVENQRIATGSPFVRLVNVQPGGTAVRLVAESKCHPLWMSHQHFPEFTAK
jgi:hypothetical protein